MRQKIWREKVSRANKIFYIFRKSFAFFIYILYSFHLKFSSPNDVHVTFVIERIVRLFF